MKSLLSILAVNGVIVVFLIACTHDVDQQTAKKDGSAPVSIIFDTDMGPDYDDIGAIALLHALADQGEVNILATVASDAHTSIAPTIEVYNTYFGRDSIPVGSTDNPLAPNFTADNHWNDSIVQKFYPDLAHKRYEASVKIYRQVLAKQPDNSVSIVTVGFMTNISELLQSEPDEYSDLNGQELVKSKVKNWVAMAGGFPQGREFNVSQDTESSIYAFEHFPKPILFSGLEIGEKIKTGAKVAALNDEANPVSLGYKINLASYSKEVEKARSSWDQTAVLVAVRNPENYFYLSGPGKFKMDKDGSNIWEPDDKGQHHFLIHKFPYSQIEETIEALMLHSPTEKQKNKRMKKAV